MSRPVVAVPADLKEFENYRWHAAPMQYLAALAEVSGAQPLVVPALGEATDADAVLSRVDGLLLTGSRSNVHPSLYGVAPSPPYEPYDEARDATSLPLIRAAIARRLPIFAICRGMQELNVALGGSIATEIQEIDGRMDHRAPDSPQQDERFAIRHEVTLAPGGRLAAILGTAPIAVNSVHRQALDRLGHGLDIEATADDGTIEAVSIRDVPGFALGLQWHPEYWASTDAPSRRLFEAFGEALRERASHTLAAE